VSDRGDYRGIYTVLTETPEFQDLGSDPQLVWFHLKLKLGPSGIDVLDAPEAVISQRSGIPSGRVADAMRILSEGGDKAWLIRERNVLWLRNALEFEPSRNLGNDNHRKSVSTHLLTLPKLSIVNDFARRYGLPIPFPEVYHADGIGIPLPSTEYGVRSTEYGDEEAHTPRVREAEEPDELADWLGPHAGVLDDCPPATEPLARRTLYQHFGPPGMRANAWARPDGSAAPDIDRPRILAVALSGYAAEGKRAIATNEFAGMLRATIAQFYAEPRKPPPGSEASQWDREAEDWRDTRRRMEAHLSGPESMRRISVDLGRPA
jgi:hypothetical protein